METILIVAAIGLAIWFFVSGAYENSFKSTQAMSPESLSNAFIETKKKILVTSAYEDEYSYKKLYSRIHDLMGAVLERHERYILDFEAKNDPTGDATQQYRYFDSTGFSNRSNRIPHDIDPSNFSDALLVYWCIFLWHGGVIKGIGKIDADPKLMQKILSHLIEKGNGDGLFLKGMTLKYGATVSCQSYPHEAKRYFEMAQAKGVGAALIELRDIAKFSQLEGIKSVQLGAIEQ